MSVIHRNFLLIYCRNLVFYKYLFKTLDIVAGELAIRSKYARLTVLVPPEPPKILKGPTIEAVEDREIMLECVSVGGKPAAEVSMRYNRQILVFFLISILITSYISIYLNKLYFTS